MAYSKLTWRSRSRMRYATQSPSRKFAAGCRRCKRDAGEAVPLTQAQMLGIRSTTVTWSPASSKPKG